MSAWRKTTVGGILLLLALGSYAISRSSLNVPLGPREYPTASALVFMRILDDWGFFHLGGISAWVPKTLEFTEASFLKFNFREPIVYVSFPPIGLWAPYAVLKLLRIFAEVPVSVSFIQIYHLLVNRIGGALALFFLGSWITRRVLSPRHPDSLCDAGGLVVAAAWIFQPLVLYWTQNVYCADDAALLPAHLLSLTVLREWSRPGNRERPLSWALFLLTIWACGTDWYGWIVALVALALLRRRGAKTAPVLAGLGLVSLIHGSQLLWLGNRFPILLDRLLYRTGNALDYTSKQPLPLSELLRMLTEHWRGYFFPLPFLAQGTSPVVLLVACVALASAPFVWGAYTRRESARPLGAAWALLVLPALLEFTFLRQHAAMHEYHAFKISGVIALSWLGIWLFCVEVSDRLSHPRLSWAVGALGLVIVACINATFSYGQFPILAKPMVTGYQDFGRYLSKTLQPDQIPVSEEYEAGWFLPQNFWYFGRLAYTPKELNDYKHRGAVNLGNSRLVYLSFHQPEPRSHPDYPCSTPWRALEVPYLDQKGFICDVRMSY